MKIENPKIINIIEKIIKKGGSPFLVGGYVRDSILNIKSKDFDIEVYNISLEDLYKITGGKLNRKFGIIQKKELNIDFAIPRKEIKNGSFYDEYDIILNPNLNFKEASIRRDFSINSLLYDLKNEKIIDNFDGIKDLKEKKIKHISLKFKEDPLRVLRAIRFSTNLNFDIEESTYKLCKEMLTDLKYVSTNKKSEEFNKIISSKNSYLKNQIKSINLLSEYIGEFNLKSFNNVCLKNYTYKELILKVILFQNNTNKLKEFIKKDKEIKLILKLINSNENINKANDLGDIYDVFIDVKNNLDIYLETLEVFEVKKDIYDYFIKIKKVYESKNWSFLNGIKDGEKIKLKQKKIVLEEIVKYV